MTGWETTEFELMETIPEKLKPYETLWSLVASHAKKYDQWFKGSMFDLNAEEVETECQKCWRQAYKLQALFKGGDLIWDVTISTS